MFCLFAGAQCLGDQCKIDKRVKQARKLSKIKQNNYTASPFDNKGFVKDTRNTGYNPWLEQRKIKSYSSVNSYKMGVNDGYFHPYKIKAEYLFGGIIPHTQDENINGIVCNKVKDLVKDPLNGFELAVEFPTVGMQNWQYYYNFPTVGVGFDYLDLGNPQMLGQSIALFPYINIPFVKNQYIDLNLRAGWGLTYITKPYVDAPIPVGVSKYSVINFAIGSHWNNYFTLGLNTEIKPFAPSVNDRIQDFLSRISFSLGGSLYHISNGSIEQPNAGLNLGLLSLGVKYKPYFTTPPEQQTVDNLPRTFTLDLTARGGVREMHRFDTQQSAVGSFNAIAYRQMSNIYRLGAGVNAFLDAAYTTYSHFHRPGGKYEDVDYTNPVNRYRVGLSICNEFVIGRVGVGFDAGVYVFDPIKVDGWNYFSVSMKYRVTDNIYVSVGLKSHGAEAEFMDFGVGYSIPLEVKKKAPEPYSPTRQKTE